ncbi:short-chain dehydrogenase [Bacillus coahuilensis m2-6]|uniref:SDR family NAD(P)-dependent oxidoreductase n=1 Tax=Bacillus coahuilensis TaxID=408580 RepID=UPI000750635A|nr:SDR family NAD(P)-dependent oxidoreductase [Bacillus coahuilensis]KUP09674.1 short-chain dehydrogenase [Bacillus coahuilensis m2-6]
MELAIVTGDSKGLGHSVSQSFLNRGIEVIGLSRSGNFLENNHYSHIQCDLGDTGNLEALVVEMAQKVVDKSPKRLYVVNNASKVEPIERLGYLDNVQIQSAIHLNYVSPLIINNTFVRELKNSEVELVFVNVSSGAADTPIYGWNVYNSTKAAMNMHTRVVGLEFEQLGKPYMSIAFNPGVMDTDMQATIRGSSEDAFSDVERFQEFKKNGALRSPMVVAEGLVELLVGSELENGRIYSVNEVL